MYSSVQLKSILVTLCLLALGVACGLGQPSRPTISILTPANDQKLVAGREVTVQAVSVSKEGVSRVELWVNGELVDTQTSNNPQSFTTLQPWTPQIAGTYLLQIKAYDINGLQSEPAAISVAVEEGNQPLSSPDTTPPTAAGGPTMTTKTDLNVRAGPSTAYPIVTVLRSGQTAAIVGTNAAKTWWQIEHFDTPEGTGWVSAHVQYSTASNTENVPVVAAQSEAEVDTPETEALLPAIHFFRADKVNISAGESVLLEWDLDDAEAAYLYPGGEAGVVAPGNLQVRPDSTTTYRLVAGNKHGEVEVFVTVTVSE